MKWNTRHQAGEWLICCLFSYLSCKWQLSVRFLTAHKAEERKIGSRNPHITFNKHTCLESGFMKRKQRCCSCCGVCVYVCVARVNSKSFVLHKSAGNSGDVRTNRAALCCSWLQRGRNRREEYREGKREQDSSCQASIAHLSHRKWAPATVSWIHLLKHCSWKKRREDICSMWGRHSQTDILKCQ